MAAYYNENDPQAAAWLRELIKAGLIADGEVDERSIELVRPDDLRGFVQCHFFAGIGGWSLALRFAGWPDSRECWTGSCPCQPYSVASVGVGGAQGHADERDLWPSWLPLIEQRAPGVVFGEQVRSAISWGWWDRAALDLEAAGYACAPCVLRADAYGADHERKRLYWLAIARSAGRQRHQPLDSVSVTAAAAFAVIGDTFTRARRAMDGDLSDLLPCNGLSVVMERDALKGYGNAIVPQVAAEVIGAYMDICDP
jgi:DNA (cytosine-5)-methyltransferase 1